MSDFQPLRRSLLIAAVAALLVLAAGVVFALTQQGRYKAETTLIVLPASTLAAQDQASFLETLSRGQVVATMAEVAQSGRFETEAEKALGLSTAEAADTTVTVTVVPSTSVLLVEAEASTARIAEQLADRTAALSATYLQSMIKPYAATQVRPAANTAYSAGTAPWIVIAGTVIAALAVALAVQQAAYQVLQPRRRSRRPLRRPPFSAADPSPAAAATPAPATPAPATTAPAAPPAPTPAPAGPPAPAAPAAAPAQAGAGDKTSTTTDPSTTESDSTNERVLFS
ncbi:hypothetical protein [Cryptosporangium aurantiacum]|uniref:hypothetical protein n=1 Tax=Cryptosporangium aurantiacum TaxID=134849 RepID=UPI0015BBF1A9|nr:hypothetical protein [Cryptosporangium aurantiacum]